MTDRYVEARVDGWRIRFMSDPSGWPSGWTLEEREGGGEEYLPSAWFLSSQDAAQWLAVQGFPDAAAAVRRMVAELVERARVGVDLPLGG